MKEKHAEKEVPLSEDDDSEDDDEEDSIYGSAAARKKAKEIIAADIPAYNMSNANAHNLMDTKNATSNVNKLDRNSSTDSNKVEKIPSHHKAERIPSYSKESPTPFKNTADSNNAIEREIKVKPSVNHDYSLRGEDRTELDETPLPRIVKKPMLMKSSTASSSEFPETSEQLLEIKEITSAALLQQQQHMMLMYQLQQQQQQQIAYLHSQLVASQQANAAGVPYTIAPPPSFSPPSPTTDPNMPFSTSPNFLSNTNAGLAMNMQAGMSPSFNFASPFASPINTMVPTSLQSPYSGSLMPSFVLANMQNNQQEQHGVLSTSASAPLLSSPSNINGNPNPNPSDAYASSPQGRQQYGMGGSASAQSSPQRAPGSSPKKAVKSLVVSI